MKKHVLNILAVLVILSMVLVACAPQPTAPPEAEAVKVVVIGKSVHPYWSNVEKGVIAAGKDLGIETVFFVPPKEDVAAQIQTMETYIAQGVTGIAIAPSDPDALEPTMKKATDAGIFVTTLDTPPVDNSVSLVYIGTDNFSAGKIAGETMARLLPDGGKVGIGRGSDTALNALQRTDGFLEGIAGTAIEALEPVNDKEDAATALQLANSTISANPDLAGAFGVYAYNGPAWATAIKEANAVGKIKLVSFDATTDIINGIKEGVIDATVAQREYDMGYKSVQIIKLMAEKGVDAALSEMKAVDGIIDTGVDVITAATLKDYEAGLDAKGIPHEWDTAGWEPAEGAAPAAPEKLTIAWIPKALNNPVFEVGRDGAFKKAEELTAETGTEVTIDYVASVASDAAEQARVVEDVIAKGVDAIGISCNDPTACEDPINKAVAAGIPVMAWDSDSPDSDRFTYLGVDNYQGGMAAAELLVKFMGEEGKVALLTGVPGAFNLEERIRGFTDGIADYPGIEVVSTVYCNDDINLGVQVVEETMQAYPDLNGWFFVGLWPLFAERGSMPLWEDAALNQGLVTIAFDTLPVELEFLQDGYLSGLVGQKYWGWGYDTVQMIYDYIVNGTRYDDWTDSGMDIVTECNVDVMAEAWATSDFTKPLPDAYECLEGAAPAAPEKLTIAWIPKALNNPVFEVGRDGAFKKAEELTAETGTEVTIDYVASVASDAAEQARVVEDVIAKGVDAIGISCNDPTACEDPINKAVAAGIPVMAWDSDSPDSDRFTYLGVDNYQGGMAAAELLVKFMGEEGKVALLTGVPGAFNLEERIRGFTDGIADYPGIEVVSTVYCNDDINLGVQVVEETMQAHPDLNGWFFVGLWPLFAERGSMPLWEDAALNKGLVTIAFDTLPVELEFLQDGYLSGLVGQKYWGWGYDTVQMIYDYIVKGARYDDWTDSGMDIVTECNVDVMAEAWATSDFTKPLPDAYECLD
jgi:ribose transport system substrate-binding protein